MIGDGQWCVCLGLLGVPQHLWQGLLGKLVTNRQEEQLMRATVTCFNRSQTLRVIDLLSCVRPSVEPVLHPALVRSSTTQQLRDYRFISIFRPRHTWTQG